MTAPVLFKKSILSRTLGLTAICLIATTFWVSHHAKASPLVLTNLEGKAVSADLIGFDENTRQIQLKKGETTYEYSLSDLDFPSKIEVLRSEEMEEVLNSKSLQKGKALPLYGLLIFTSLGLVVLIGLPTFQGSAYLITGQEGFKLHFIAWIKIVALVGLIIGIRIAALGGIQWTEMIYKGFYALRPEDGLALIFALIGSIGLLKHHYRESIKLAAITLGVHILSFALILAGLIWLGLRWYGGDWTVPANELLTRLILQPFELI